MSRLTNTELAGAMENGYFVSIDSKTVPVPTVEDIYVKLSKYEKLEEELGIDLITKDKVEQSSTCYYNENNKIRKVVIIENDRVGVWVETTDIKRIFLPYKDYGKTWSLIKDKLINN